MKPSLHLLLAASLLPLVLGSSAHAFTFSRNDSTGLPHILASGNVPLKIMLGTTPALSDGSNFNTSVQAAALAWNAQCGAIQFVPQLLAAGPAIDRNGINEVAFSNTVFGTDFENNTLAVTLFYTRGNETVQGDVIFNNAKTWDSYRGNVRSANDIQRVALHELGHLLGLDHPDEVGQSFTPTPIMNSRLTSRDTLTTDDISGAQSLYGPPGVPANNNFANAIAITLGSAASVTVNGFNTNANKEIGEPLHATVTGGRSVWWKWSAPSAGLVTLDTRNSYFDTLLGVYTGTTLTNLVTVASNDDINSGIVQASALTFTAVADSTYYFAVDGFDATSARITLTLGFSIPSANGFPTVPSQPGKQPSTPGQAVTFTIQPTHQMVTVGQTATFSALAIPLIGSSQPTYQWFFKDAILPGATSTTLTVANARADIDAGNYTVIASVDGGSITSYPAKLTINPAPPALPSPPPLPPASSSGGGGGAPSLWFWASLTLLGLRRALCARR